MSNQGIIVNIEKLELFLENLKACMSFHSHHYTLNVLARAIRKERN